MGGDIAAILASLVYVANNSESVCVKLELGVPVEENACGNGMGSGYRQSKPCCRA